MIIFDWEKVTVGPPWGGLPPRTGANLHIPHSTGKAISSSRQATSEIRSSTASAPPAASALPLLGLILVILRVNIKKVDPFGWFMEQIHTKCESKKKECQCWGYF